MAKGSIPTKVPKPPQGIFYRFSLVDPERTVVAYFKSLYYSCALKHLHIMIFNLLYHDGLTHFMYLKIHEKIK